MSVILIRFAGHIHSFCLAVAVVFGLSLILKSKSLPFQHLAIHISLFVDNCGEHIQYWWTLSTIYLFCEHGMVKFYMVENYVVKPGHRLNAWSEVTKVENRVCCANCIIAAVPRSSIEFLSLIWPMATIRLRIMNSKNWEQPKNELWVSQTFFTLVSVSQSSVIFYFSIKRIFFGHISIVRYV